jgi:hypothetical protein
MSLGSSVSIAGAGAGRPRNLVFLKRLSGVTGTAIKKVDLWGQDECGANQVRNNKCGVLEGAK